MDVSKLRIHGVNALVTLIALTIGAGTMRANTLLNSSPVVSGTVTCATLTGPGSAQTITVKPASALSGTSAVTVTFVPVTGLVITPASNVLTSANSTAGVVFTVNAAPGCAGLVSGVGTSNTVQFKTAEANPTVANANDASATVSSTLTINGSALVAPAVTVYCSKSGSTYIPSSTPAVVSVTSAAVGGTPFTVTGSLPAWLSLSSLAGGTATATPVTINASALSPCASLTPGNTASSTFTLTAPQSQTTNVNVTISVIAASPLTAAPASISLSHVKGSGAAQTQNVSVTSSSSGTYFTVNTATLPIWLTVNSTYAFAPASLTFSTTSVADTMPPGTYSATVYLQVYGLGDLPISVTLFVTNAAPKLSISSANPVAITWVQGTAPPTTSITAISSDSPIPYTITTGGNLAPIVSAAQLTGLAYSFGTTIAVTFPGQVYQTALPGTVITGTVSLTWGSPAQITVVTINLTISSPGATLSSLSPATIPTAVAPTTYPVVLSGSGFVGGSNTALTTKVGIVVGGVMVADSNLSLPNVVNPSNIIETITVPASSDALLPFAPGGVNGVVGGSVTLGVCNGNCFGQAPTGTITLTIGGGPVIQGVTSSSSFTEVTPPALPSIAPYDMISIFGVNFCSSVGTGCSTSTLLAGSVSQPTLTFPLFLSPDPTPAPNTTDTRRKLTVTFYPHGTTSNGLSAPLLFATNGQINAMAPGALTPASEYDIVVGFSSNTATLNSAPFPVNAVASDPGIFTIGSDGQGGAAALQNSNYSLITSVNPAGMRSGGSDSDILQLYLTGLGAPNSNGSDLSGSNGCIAATSGTGNYLGVLNTATGVSPALTNIDGTVIQSSLILSGNFPPCFTSQPTVKVGGVSVTPTYTGFVPDSIAGLYQIDFKLPVSTATFYPNYPAMTNPIVGLTSPVQLPVQVTMNGATTQTGVTLWVAPRLSVAAPSTISGTVGVTWSSSNNSVVATEGTAPYHYAVTSGVLPAGLTLNALTGAISGDPAANSNGSYVVTVTATDSANAPVTGSVTFTLTVAADLYLTSTGTAPYSTTFNSANASVTTVAATGGTPSYTYTITSPSPDPAGITITGGVLGTTAALPAGTYPVTVHAVDSASTPLTGNISFSLVVALAMSNSSLTAQTHGTSGILTTVTATGNTGTLVYTLDPTSLAYGFTIDSSGELEPTTVAGSGTYTVTVTATDSVTMAPGATAYGTGSTTLTVTVN